MNGKKNHSLKNYSLMDGMGKKNCKEDTKNYKNLSCLYYKYIKYNPELEKVLNQKRIDTKQYLQFLGTLLNKVNTEQN